MYNKAILSGSILALDIVDKAPDIDVVPVMHGEWIVYQCDTTEIQDKIDNLCEQEDK